MQYKNIYFFIGTTAELIKMMPVMRACWQRQIPFRIVASGQNNIQDSELLSLVGKSRVDVVLFEGEIKKSAASLLLWFCKTFLRSAWKLRGLVKGAPGRSVMVVHGDTVSTVMGALLGKIHRMDVAHVEAGLRSFNYMKPFPEEIDRVITSRLTDIHFCPNEWAVNNIASLKGEKVNTLDNTLRDALAVAQSGDFASMDGGGKVPGPYFVFVLHRQENLFNDQLVKSLVSKAMGQSQKLRCVFLLHHLTEVALNRLGLLDALEKSANITLLRRLPYMQFMQLLDGADYVVTDGGSNQEECYYLGKPCLVLRGVTERTEGLGHNVVLSKLDEAVIDEFLRDPYVYARAPSHMMSRPSDVIVSRLVV